MPTLQASSYVLSSGHRVHIVWVTDDHDVGDPYVESEDRLSFTFGDIQEIMDIINSKESSK